MRYTVRNKVSNHRSLKKPIYIFCHHKTGTVLFLKIFVKISKAFSLNFLQIYGYCDSIPEVFDIVLFSHSTVSSDILNSDFIGVHIIRDPREILISSYLYHLRTKEAWCIVEANQNADLCFPFIPTFKEQCSNEDKKEYLRQLDGKSYQAHLKELSQIDGILFELNNYSGWTIDCIQSWCFNNANILEIKLESIIKDFDAIFEKIFLWLLFDKISTKTCLDISQSEDLNKRYLSGDTLELHASKLGPFKWKSFFTDHLKIKFYEKYRYLIDELGYESININ